MKNFYIALFIFLLFSNKISAQETISGKINHDDINYQNRVVDTKNSNPISGAKISIPSIGYSTYSDEAGAFKLNANIVGKTVLIVEHDGYKTFSLTIDNTVLSSPLKLGIEELSGFNLQVTHGVIHLGDNLYSNNSANSRQFRLSADGSFLSKKFDRPKMSQSEEAIVCIGTIIGLDTKKAKEAGQNRIVSVYASPAEIYVNGSKIANLELNGDNIEIPIPRSLLKDRNELVIKTGRNLFQTEYIDYDDIELANVRVETRNKNALARH